MNITTALGIAAALAAPVMVVVSFIAVLAEKFFTNMPAYARVKKTPSQSD